MIVLRSSSRVNSMGDLLILLWRLIIECGDY